MAGSPFDEDIVSADKAVKDAKDALDAAVKAAELYANRPLQINLTMDGKTVVQMLQNYRRSTGGAPLGLG